jgi:CubicO group peptidase (beta-lactamase class C family)
MLASGLLSPALVRWTAISAQGPTRSDAGALAAKLDAIGRAVEAETRAGRATGVSISVAVKGRIVWERGFGFANRESQRPVTAHTPFSLASVTKPFTTAAVMRLVRAGKLDLDSPIDRYLRNPLPASQFDTRAVTLRLLGGHAGGLPSLFNMFEQAATAPGLVDLIRNCGELAYPAGERFEYANLGYSLLGEAVSSVTGQEFATSLKNLIIQPMGLKDTFFDTDFNRMRSAAGRYDENNQAIPFYTTATPPSGELYASAHDLSLFAANMMGMSSGGPAPLLDREALATLFAPVFTSRTQAFTTFGWSGRDVAGERMIVKTGGQPGVAARLTLLPTRNISIAVIANRDDNRKLVADLSCEVASALVTDWSAPDFHVDDVPEPDASTADYDGSWSGSIRNGDFSHSVRIVFNATGQSRCIVADGSERPIRELTQDSRTLTFNLAGDLVQVGSNERQLEFKLIARKDGLVGRCLSLFEKPGFASTEPHIVQLSRSS